jgi:hypothetical protein
LPKNKKGATWDIKEAVGSAAGRERCIRLPARSARRNAKYPSSPERIVRYIARNVSQNEKIADVK